MKKTGLKYYLIGIIITILIFTAVGCNLQLPKWPTVTVTTTVTPPPTTPTWTLSTTTTPTLTLTSTTTTTTTTTPNNSVLPDLASVVARVKPSVVAINTEITSYDIFNQAYTSEAAGSGWILDSNGLIATNNHVIDGANSISVTFEDGTTESASVIGADAVSDLAVLKVNKSGLPAVTIGDSSKLQVGQWVLAIGNALGEGISATEGIVSRTGVSISVDTGSTLYDLIQTSAAINPGNSGGPLVNLAGEVVGITSAKLAEVGVEGMGYAISIKTAMPYLETLVQKGHIARPYLGVQMQTVNQLLVLRYGLGVDHGALVVLVSSNTPAAKAGIKAGDVIVSINGKDVQTAEDATQAIFSAQIGQTISIVYYRGSVNNTTQATLIESPA